VAGLVRSGLSLAHPEAKNFGIGKKSATSSPTLPSARSWMMDEAEHRLARILDGWTRRHRRARYITYVVVGLACDLHRIGSNGASVGE
jgi:hypothetical protein